MAEIDTLIAAMEDKSDALEDLGYRVRFDMKDGGSILLDATDGNVEIEQDETGEAEADTVLILSSDNLEKLINGKLNPMLAFSTGRLKVRGSQGVALKLASLLEEAS
ncbi:SCP2 sterol-binding domain-containing protein [Martelella limonii]|uniref:SCP2 sterol-binding domain-containing protein n=1 Tax=Martelella limonii TaxID=1647649 RepID=UPI001580B8A7|nr:SCP2 sterol-binding domain-containing protein [Martelella limonii]